MKRPRCYVAMIWHGLALAIGMVASTVHAEETATVMKRMSADLQYLASDALEGRGITTKGIHLAAEHIRKQFKEAGLNSAVANGSYFQPFEFRAAVRFNKDKTHVTLQGPDGNKRELKLGSEVSAIAADGELKLDMPIVFAGYGITAPEYKYDDYQGLDVAGKLVLVIRKEPQQNDEKSVFKGKETTDHASLASKMRNAKNHKAAGIIIVNDVASSPEGKDDLLGPGQAGRDTPAGFVVLQVKQKLVNELLAGSPAENLAAVEKAIDGNLQPRSMELKWSAQGMVSFDNNNTYNVVGVIDGEGPLAQETVILGAHYDHIGYGGMFGRSLAAINAAQPQIHNGADDNGSGTTLLIEMARRYGARSKIQKPRRRMVFMAFSAEESGLIGSQRYAENPIYPLKDTVAMFNFDMVGRLNGDNLTLNGTKTAKEFQSLVDWINTRYGFKLGVNLSVDGASDHASFYRKKIPVLFFFTGTHSDYHRPTDDVEKINFTGMARIGTFAEELIDNVIIMPTRPTFTEAPRAAQPGRRAAERKPVTRSGPGPWLGTMPDYATNVKEGMRLSDVSPNSPAQAAGLKGGDIVLSIGGAAVNGIEGLMEILGKHKPGDKVIVKYRRGEKEHQVEVTFGRRPSSNQ